MNEKTYEWLIDFFSIDGTVIICLNFEQRRTATYALCDMGFVCGDDTMDYIEQSESNKDMQFMNPGVMDGTITYFNSKYIERHRSIEFATFMEIFNSTHFAEPTESEEDFELRIKSLLCF